MVVQHPVLRKIHFGYPNDYGNESMDARVYIYHTKHANYIECEDTPEFIFQLFKLNATNLTSLTVWRQNTSIRVLMLCVIEFLNQSQTIRSLCISRCLKPFVNITQSIWTEFCNTVCCHKSLVKLNLSHNQMNSFAYTDTGDNAISLAEILFQQISSSECKLEALNMANNCLGSDHEDIATSINHMLTSNTSLRTLDLSYNADLSVEHISRAIGLNRYIKTLNISGTDLFHSEMIEFYNALKINTSLVELNLSGPHFNVKKNTIDSICNALASNCTLEVLGLSGVDSWNTNGTL